MTLYTIVPDEIIFPHQHDKIAQMIEMKVNGVHVMVEHEGGSSFRIDRIVSTNPEDYMKANVQPGEVVNVFEPLRN